MDHANLLITCHRSLYYYDPAAARILLAFKADGWSRLASFFAPRVDAYLDALQEDNLLICPVPSLASSIRKRGFDQMRELSLRLSSRHRNRVFPLLSRRHGLQQKHLDRKERVKNMESCLEYHDIRRVASGNVPPVKKGPVLLLDDVKTTGASLHACASILVSRGWGPIRSLTLFLD